MALCPYNGPASNGTKIIRDVPTHHSGEKFVMIDEIDCKSINLRYLLSGEDEASQYVRVTGRKGVERFSEHLRSMRDKNTSMNAGKHFQKPGHSSQNFIFIPYLKSGQRNFC